MNESVLGLFNSYIVAYLFLKKNDTISLLNINRRLKDNGEVSLYQSLRFPSVYRD